MSKPEVKSIFNDVLEDVKSAKTVDEAKSIILIRLQNSKIDDEDRQSILEALESKDTLEKVLFYIYNAVLAYEGLKAIK